MFLWRRRQRPLVVGLFLIFSFLALSLQLKEGRAPLFPLNKTLISITSPVQSLVKTSQEAVVTIWRDYLGLFFVKQENVRLKEEINRLQWEMMKLKEELQAQGRLAKLLELKEQIPFATVAARVIARDPTGWFKALMIDRGTDDGIKKNQAVISYQGLVGRVVEVFPRFAKILLMVDPNSAVDSLVMRSRDVGIVYGRSGSELVMRYLPLTATVTTGDLVVSSGLEGVYPKGITVGQITQVRKGGAGIFLEALVAPSVNFDKLEEVLVVKGEQGGVAPSN